MVVFFCRKNHFISEMYAAIENWLLQNHMTNIEIKWTDTYAFGTFPSLFVFIIRFPSSLYLATRRGSSSTRGYYHFMMDFCLIDCHRNGQTQSRRHHISCRLHLQSQTGSKNHLLGFSTQCSLSLAGCYLVFPLFSAFISFRGCPLFFIDLLLFTHTAFPLTPAASRSLFSRSAPCIFLHFCCYSSCSDIELLSLSCFMNNFVQEITRNQHTIKINAYNEQQHKWKIIIYQQQQRDHKHT